MLFILVLSVLPSVAWNVHVAGVAMGVNLQHIHKFRLHPQWQFEAELVALHIVPNHVAL